MDTTAAYAVYPEDVEVAEVVRVLSGAGIKKDSICLMFAPTHPVAAIVKHANLLVHEREASAETAGWISWLSDFGAVVIPTIGFFIRSRPFLHALLEASEAPSLCGSFRILSGLGLPEPNAERLEMLLQEVTGFLVYVSSVETTSVNWALEVFRMTGAEESASLDSIVEAAP